MTPSTEAVRIWNSLLAKTAGGRDFGWTSDDWPPAFKSPATSDSGFEEAISDLGIAEPDSASGLQRALAIAAQLADGAYRRRSIKSNTIDTYFRMISQGGGHCSHFTQVFHEPAAARGLPVRQWGISFDDSGGDGHASNEMFDPDFGQCLMIGSSKSLCSVDRRTCRPLSALQFRDAIVTPDPNHASSVVRILNNAFGFRANDALLEYFRRGQDQCYLWPGNNSLSYGANRLVIAGSPVLRSAEQALGIIGRPQFHIRIPLMGRMGRNNAVVAALYATRIHLLLMSLVAIVVSIVTVYSVTVLWALRTTA